MERRKITINKLKNMKKDIIYLFLVILLVGGFYVFLNKNTVDSFSQKCFSEEGFWLDEYSECEGVSQNWCENNGGVFSECGSACRHDEGAVFCTLQCVPFCSFSTNKNLIIDFQSCVDAGNPVMESYPRQCHDKIGGETYIENLNSQDNLKNLIILENLKDGDRISNPLVLEGQARGVWFFEGSFPVVLTNWDGLIIAEGYATAQKEWMTENFVPFKATLEFIKPEAIEGVKNSGSLILKKDNPSGLPEYDEALEITVLFE